jgi:hypothetical protein
MMEAKGDALLVVPILVCLVDSLDHFPKKILKTQRTLA